MREPFGSAREILRIMLFIQVSLGIVMIYLTNYYQQALNFYVADTEWNVLSGLLFNNYLLGFQLIITYLCGIAIWRRVWGTDYTKNIDLMLKVWMFFCFMVIFCGVASVWSLFSSADALENTAELSLLKGVDLYYSCPEWKLLWDNLQYQKQCCGVHSYKDWATAGWMSGDVRLRCRNKKTVLAPYACCRRNCISCYETYIPGSGHGYIPYLKKGQINTHGCLPLFTATMWRVLYAVSALMFVACKISVFICCFVRYIINRQYACICGANDMSLTKNHKKCNDKHYRCFANHDKRRRRRYRGAVRCATCGASDPSSSSGSDGSGANAGSGGSGGSGSFGVQSRSHDSKQIAQKRQEKRKTLNQLMKKVSKKELNALLKQNVSQHTMELLLKPSNELHIDSEARHELEKKIVPVLSAENQILLKNLMEPEDNPKHVAGEKSSRRPLYRIQRERQQQKQTKRRQLITERRQEIKKGVQQAPHQQQQKFTPSLNPPPHGPSQSSPQKQPKTTKEQPRKSADEEITEKLEELIQGATTSLLEASQQKQLKKKFLPILLHGTPAQLATFEKQAHKMGFLELYKAALKIVKSVREAHGQSHTQNQPTHPQSQNQNLRSDCCAKKPVNPYCVYCCEREML